MAAVAVQYFLIIWTTVICMIPPLTPLSLVGMVFFFITIMANLITAVTVPGGANPPAFWMPCCLPLALCCLPCTGNTGTKSKKKSESASTTNYVVVVNKRKSRARDVEEGGGGGPPARPGPKPRARSVERREPSVPHEGKSDGGGPPARPTSKPRKGRSKSAKKSRGTIVKSDVQVVIPDATSPSPSHNQRPSSENEWTW